MTTAVQTYDYTKAIKIRETEALTDVAPVIIDIVKTLGFVTPHGSFQLTHQGGSKFSWDPATQIVLVEHGANDMFRVNVFFKTVSIFKRGSWERAFDELQLQLENVEKGVAQQRNFVYVLDNLGLERP
jgi:hypothetical protein